MPKVRAIGYVRQSRQSEAGASPEAQKRAIEQYAESQGWRLVDVLSDLGKSGFDPKALRPGLETMFSTIERGGVERVIVWKLDRLTRRGIVEALTLVERIENAGAALVSVTEPFDTSTALGQGIFALLLSLARAESEKLAERVKSGKAIVRERGGWLGGPVPYGFSVERVERGGFTQSQLVADADTAPTVRGMVDAILSGDNVRQIVQRLNADRVRPPRGINWTHATVFNLLRSPVVSQLCTKAEWRTLQTRLEPRKGRKAQQPSLLGGIARCAGCGSTMGGDRSGNGYRCNLDASGHKCPAPARVPMRDTDAVVLDVLTFGVLNPDADPAALRALRRWWALQEGGADTAELLAERDIIEAARARLRELYVAGDFADDPAQYRKLTDGYAAQLADLSKQLQDIETLPAPKQMMRAGFVDGLDFDTQRSLIDALLLVECVKADRPGIRFVPATRLRVGLRTPDGLQPLEIL